MDKLINKQTVRILDVFLIAPFLIYASFNVKAKPIIKNGLLALGIATGIYNGLNFIIEYKKEITNNQKQ